MVKPLRTQEIQSNKERGGWLGRFHLVGSCCQLAATSPGRPAHLCTLHVSGRSEADKEEREAGKSRCNRDGRERRRKLRLTQY